jgi:predicted transcriptional regulator
MKPLNIGILTQEEIRQRMLAVAMGEHKPKATEPRIWFTSMRSLAKVMRHENKHVRPVVNATEFRIVV